MKYHVFFTYHPLVLFLYFAAVIGFSMCMFNPIYIGLSFLAASAYFVYLKGFHAYRKTLTYSLLLFLVIAIINPLVNSMGLTVLFYLFERPITAEAIAFGVCSGGMLLTILLWFSCYSQVMTSDKFIALFGKLVPTTAMTFSMILRYVPMMLKRGKEIQVAQRALTGNGGTKTEKIKQAVHMSSILMSWSMEESIETANAMKCRGYGFNKRTQASNYRFTLYDFIVGLIILLLAAVLIISAVAGVNKTVFYPYIQMRQTYLWVYGVFALICMLPLIIEARSCFICKQ